MIILALMLTALIYLTFPVGYRIIYGKVPKGKARKMAFINSAVCAVIFSVLSMIVFADDPTYMPSFLPAVSYYFIANAILKEKEDPNVLK